jgi:hypothetical protein
LLFIYIFYRRAIDTLEEVDYYTGSYTNSGDFSKNPEQKDPISGRINQAVLHPNPAQGSKN